MKKLAPTFCTFFSSGWSVSGLGELSLLPVVYVGVCSAVSSARLRGGTSRLHRLEALHCKTPTTSLRQHAREVQYDQAEKAKLTKQQHDIVLPPTFRLARKPILNQLILHAQANGVRQRIPEDMIPYGRERRRGGAAFGRGRAGRAGRRVVERRERAEEAGCCRAHTVLPVTKGAGLMSIEQEVS